MHEDRGKGGAASDDKQRAEVWTLNGTGGSMDQVGRGRTGRGRRGRSWEGGNDVWRSISGFTKKKERE